MAAVLLLAACGDATRGLPQERVVLHTPKGDFAFDVEIADTEGTRTKGLMFRATLAPDAGMLFDFEREQPVAFWMENTLIPLDMIFVRADGVVANVHINARPGDRTAIPSAGPVRFVLEINGGKARELGALAGAKLEHARTAPGVSP